MYYAKNELVEAEADKILAKALRLIERNPNLSYYMDKIGRDEALSSHSNNVAKISAIIGAGYRFNLNEMLSLCIGAYLHDVGKTDLNSKILYKPDVFSRDEKIYTQSHTSIGYKLLRDTGLNREVLDIVKSHHERLDGSGYPNCSFAESISIYTQIVSVADVFEAMTADRCYRRAMRMDDVLKILFSDDGLNQTALEILAESVGIRKETKIAAFGRKTDSIYYFPTRKAE